MTDAYDWKIIIKQIWSMTQANMRSRYRGSAAGFLWVILNPLIIYSSQTFVFHYILKIQVPNYFVFLISGLLPWLLISQSLEQCTGLFVASGRLLKSYPIHPVVCLLAQILDNFITLSLLMLALFPMILFSDVPIWKFFAFFFPLLNCVIAVIGMAWFLATLNVFFRDTRFVVTFFLNVMFFLTPIFYPEQFVEAKYRWIFNLNVFHHLLLPFRNLVESPVNPDLLKNSVVALMLSCALCIIAAAYWRGKRNVAYFYL